MFERSQPARCVSCGEPFPFLGDGAQQRRTAETYACNEFCAGGAEDRPQGLRRTDVAPERFTACGD